MDKSQKNIEAFKSDVDYFHDGAEQKIRGSGRFSIL